MQCIYRTLLSLCVRMCRLLLLVLQMLVIRIGLNQKGHLNYLFLDIFKHILLKMAVPNTVALLNGFGIGVG